MDLGGLPYSKTYNWVRVCPPKAVRGAGGSGQEGAERSRPFLYGFSLAKCNEAGRQSGYTAARCSASFYKAEFSFRSISRTRTSYAIKLDGGAHHLPLSAAIEFSKFLLKLANGVENRQLQTCLFKKRTKTNNFHLSIRIQAALAECRIRSQRHSQRRIWRFFHFPRSCTWRT